MLISYKRNAEVGARTLGRDLLSSSSPGLEQPQDKMVLYCWQHLTGFCSPLRKDCHITYSEVIPVFVRHPLKTSGLMRVTLIKMLLQRGTARRCAGLNYDIYLD